MIGIAEGEVSAPFAGEIYCSLIEACQEVCDLGRAAEWTAALTRWPETQPGLLMFTGQCAVHRGQIMRVRGAYREALDEFRAAWRSVHRDLGRRTPLGWRRLSGERSCACWVATTRPRARTTRRVATATSPNPGSPCCGWLAAAPTPRGPPACALLAEADGPVQRARLLPPVVEILLAVGEVERARETARELQELASSFKCSALLAMAASAAGRLELDTGDAAGALPYLRRAAQQWTQLGCPYEAARAKMLIGRACFVLGDVGSSSRHFEAAGRAFTELGAMPALAELNRLTLPTRPPDGLTDREVEVLRLVAAGKSNAQIAEALVLSDRTVARRLSNIFDKISVPSRTAAAAYAYEHDLC